MARQRTVMSPNGGVRRWPPFMDLRWAARTQGARLRRSRLHHVDVEQARQLRAEGWSLRAIAPEDEHLRGGGQAGAGRRIGA